MPLGRIIQIYSENIRFRHGERKRVAEAQATWFRAHGHRSVCAARWQLVSVQEKDLHRNAATVLGDPKPIPYIKDIVDSGLDQVKAAPNDHFIFLNDDCGVVENIADDICSGMGYASRRDFISIPRRLTKESVAKGAPHVGIDAIWMPVYEWAAVRNDFPDMLLGRSRWDLVMRRVLKNRGAKEAFNCLAHQLHEPWWIASENDPSGLWNIKCFEEFEKANGPIWDFYSNKAVE